MANSVNIKIPQALLGRIIDLLQCWDLDGYDEFIQDDFYEVFSALLKKKRSLELRNDYEKLVNASDEDSRVEARMRYLQRKYEIFGEVL